MRRIRRAGLAAGAVSMVAIVAVAQADTITATAGAGAGGSKAKPAVNAPFSTVTESGATAGDRPATPTKLVLQWTGEQQNGAGIPTCSAATITASESTSKCPKGSIVGSGSLVAKLGAAGDPTSSVPCRKSFSIVASSPTSTLLFISGPSSQCDGLTYLPPITEQWSNAGGNATLTLSLPTTITHPIPGLEGAISTLTTKFKKVVVGGHGYLSGIGCTGGRKFTFTAYAPGYPGGKLAQTASAGPC